MSRVRTTSGSPRAGAPGFTILELLLAMVIFSMLGLVVVFLMRQGMNLFTTGTQDSAVQDRADTVLPKVRKDLLALYTGDDFSPPPLAPDPERLLASGKDLPVPPPVDVRLRSGFVVLRDAPEGPMKDARCPFIAFVIANAGEWKDPLLRREAPAGVAAKEYVPAEVNQVQGTETAFKPSGGLMEILWIAIPEDAAQPGVMTLRRGFRAPIGGAESLLDPANFDTIDEIKKRCPVEERGVLSFGALWRNAFATSWDPGPGGGISETEPYVDAVWDSTRALDKTFRLYRGPESLPDPSDDRFPTAVRLEVTLAATSQRGYAPETFLGEPLDDASARVRLTDLNPLYAKRGALEGEDRWFKVDAEWVGFRLSSDNPNASEREVTVRRGQRGTKAVRHEDAGRVYVGTLYRQEVRLRMSRDAYARKQSR